MSLIYGAALCVAGAWGAKSLASGYEGYAFADYIMGCAAVLMFLGVGTALVLRVLWWVWQENSPED